MSNFGLYKAFDKLGIDYAKTPVGDKYVYEHMAQTGCRIGGEQSGHIIFSKYATTGDPHVDIAMFCIYSLYQKEQVDHLIDLYFEGNCDDRTRIKIYCYIAVCGLLWSNWCEYKRNLGVEFGEYSLRQYRYAKDYYKIVQQELGEEEKETCTK